MDAVALMLDAATEETLEHRSEDDIGARMQWRWSDALDAWTVVIRCGGCSMTSKRNPTRRWSDAGKVKWWMLAKLMVS